MRKQMVILLRHLQFSLEVMLWAANGYSDLAAGNGVKAGIASVQGQEVKVLAEPAMGQLQVKVPEGMTRFFFEANSPEGLGAWYQTIEKGFAKNLPEQAASMHIEVLRELLDRLKETGHDHVTARHLSMGMTNDFEIAVEEGATLVRVGTALFE